MRRYSAKETYNLKEPTNPSHPVIVATPYMWNAALSSLVEVDYVVEVGKTRVFDITRLLDNRCSSIVEVYFQILRSLLTVATPYRSRLQKSPIKKTMFYKRDMYFLWNDALSSLVEVDFIVEFGNTREFYNTR